MSAIMPSGVQVPGLWPLAGRCADFSEGSANYGPNFLLGLRLVWRTW
jgi:hypothetical protein